MGWSKRQLVADGWANIGLGGAFNLSPEMQADGLNKLDSMLAEWTLDGIEVGALLPQAPDQSDPDQDSGIPDFAVAPITANLGIRLAKTIGKDVSIDLRIEAKDGYDRLVTWSVKQRTRKVQPIGPRGAGHERCGGRPFYAPTNPEGTIEV